MPGGHRSAHVANRGDPTGIGVDFPGPHTQRYHGHRGIGLLETLCKVAHIHSSKSQSPVLLCPPRVPGCKRDGDDYNGYEYNAIDSHCRPQLPLHGLSWPPEVLRHQGQGPPNHDLGGIGRENSHVHTLGDFLAPPTSGADTE